MQIKFFSPVTVQGVQYLDGDIVDESDIPPGSLECLIGYFAHTYTLPVVPQVAESIPEPIEKTETVPAVEQSAADLKPVQRRKGR